MSLRYNGLDSLLVDENVSLLVMTLSIIARYVLNTVTQFTYNNLASHPEKRSSNRYYHCTNGTRKTSLKCHHHAPICPLFRRKRANENCESQTLL